jgi:hypothetical protein
MSKGSLLRTCCKLITHFGVLQRYIISGTSCAYCIGTTVMTTTPRRLHLLILHDPSALNFCTGITRLMTPCKSLIDKQIIHSVLCHHLQCIFPKLPLCMLPSLACAKRNWASGSFPARICSQPPRCLRFTTPPSSPPLLTDPQLI